MSFENKIQDWSDEKVLDRLLTIITGRDVTITTTMIQNDDGLVTGQTLVFACGDKFFSTPPVPLDWPLQPVPMPEAFKKKAH